MKTTLATVINYVKKLEGIEIPIPLAEEARIDEGEAVLVKKRDDFIIQMSQYADSVDEIERVRKSLRKIIYAANYSNNMNSIMSKISMIDRVLTRLKRANEVTSSYENIVDGHKIIRREDIQPQIDLNEAKDAENRILLNMVRLPSAEEVKETLDVKINELNFQREELIQKRDNVNHGHYVSISADDCRVLENYKIIRPSGKKSGGGNADGDGFGAVPMPAEMAEAVQLAQDVIRRR